MGAGAANPAAAPLASATVGSSQPMSTLPPNAPCASGLACELPSTVTGLVHAASAGAGAASTPNAAAARRECRSLMPSQRAGGAKVSRRERAGMRRRMGVLTAPRLRLRVRVGADRAALAGLAAVLAGGVLVRGLLMEAWSPAFMGWPDAKSYLDVAHGELFSNVLRPAGYAMFVRALDGLYPSIKLLVLVNHALGLATAALLYATVARLGAPRALGLVPAAVVALSGDVAFVEHSPLSEPLFAFLVALAAYASVRSLDDAHAGWPAVAGLALAYATTVRVVGAPLLVVFAAWLVVASRVRTAAIAAAAALALLGAYQAAEQASVGATGLSRHSAWHLYARVAGFADCARFRPPAGTRQLCERTPRRERGTVDQYLFTSQHSPAYRAFGDPFTSSPAHVAALGAFARTVIVHQPLDYLREVSGD